MLPCDGFNVGNHLAAQALFRSKELKVKNYSHGDDKNRDDREQAAFVGAFQLFVEVSGAIWHETISYFEATAESVWEAEERMFSQFALNSRLGCGESSAMNSTYCRPGMGGTVSCKRLKSRSCGELFTLTLWFSESASYLRFNSREPSGM